MGHCCVALPMEVRPQYSDINSKVRLDPGRIVGGAKREQYAHKATQPGWTSPVPKTPRMMNDAPRRRRLRSHLTMPRVCSANSYRLVQDRRYGC